MDTSKSKRRNNLIIILCVIVLVSIYVTIERREVVILDTKWHVINSACEVSFQVKNNKPSQVWTNVTIKALRKHQTAAGNISNQVVGEKSLAIVINPDEVKKISETVPVTAPPEWVTIKTWKPH